MDVILFVSTLLAALANALALADRFRRWRGNRTPRTHGRKDGRR